MKRSNVHVFVTSVFLMAWLASCAPAPTPPVPWSLVVIGDSIALNNPIHCYGCTGFVTRYATSTTETTGHPVNVQNFSRMGSNIDGLMDDLDTYESRRVALSNADIIIVGIANNDTAWNRDDDPCDGPGGDEMEWSKYNAACISEWTEFLRPRFEEAFARIADLRTGKPTLLLTINAYNFWNSQSDAEVLPDEMVKARDLLDVWNKMICQSAEKNGFNCADIYHAFNGTEGLTPAPDLIATGNIHPSDKGNEVIAKVLSDLGYAPLVP